MKTLFNISFLSLLLFVGSCKVSTTSDPNPAGTTKAELLAGKTSKSWETTAIIINGVDAFSLNKACSKDDILVFNSSKSYERNEGAVKCKTSDAQVFEKGVWTLLNADTELSTSLTKYKIVELSSSTLKLSYKNIGGETIEENYKALSSN